MCACMWYAFSSFMCFAAGYPAPSSFSFFTFVFLSFSLSSAAAEPNELHCSSLRRSALILCARSLRYLLIGGWKCALVRAFFVLPTVCSSFCFLFVLVTPTPSPLRSALFLQPPIVLMCRSSFPLSSAAVCLSVCRLCQV